MRQVLVAVGLLLFAGLVQAEPVVDVTKIAGKSEAEVANFLGKSISCEKIKQGKKCKYKKAETEIVFIQGKADWITIEGLDHIPFTNAALVTIGLKESRPVFSNNFTKRWEWIEGIRAVSLFKGESSSDYAYIKVITK